MPLLLQYARVPGLHVVRSFVGTSEGVDVGLTVAVGAAVGTVVGENTGTGGQVAGCGSGSASWCQDAQRSAAQKWSLVQLQY